MTTHRLQHQDPLEDSKWSKMTILVKLDFVGLAAKQNDEKSASGEEIGFLSF